LYESSSSSIAGHTARKEIHFGESCTLTWTFLNPSDRSILISPVYCAAGPGVPIPCGRPVAASAVDSVAGIQHRSIELADSKIVESSKVAGPAPASRAAEMEVLPAGPMLVIASSRHLVLVIPAIIVAWRRVCMHRVCMARARRQSKSSAREYSFFLAAWSRPWQMNAHIQTCIVQKQQLLRLEQRKHDRCLDLKAERTKL